ncbi:MAG: prepilin peptidase [Deltaproteobacteria bacterium]|nr:prepilin peptidase [Deltaproteobacteria bacterium]
MVITVFIFIFGLVIGSFLNVVIYRLPRHQSLVYPPSHCPSCDRRIKPYDNIPLLSYVFLLGRCRYCRGRISPRYPLVELLAGTIAALLSIRYGPGTDAAILFILSSALIAITFIDIDHGIIPNVLSYPGIVLGFLSSFLLHLNSPAGSLSGMLVGGGILLTVAYVYKKIAGVEGMGMGDVKLMVMLGAFLGWQASIFIIIVSSLLGSIAGVGLMIFAGKTRKYAIPYGPFISASAIVYLFYGRPLIDLYLKVIGHA